METELRCIHLPSAIQALQLEHFPGRIPSTDRSGGERVFRSKVRPKIPWGVWVVAAELSRDDFDNLIKALPGGWWKSKVKSKSGERYVLRIRVDPVEGDTVAGH